MWHERADYGGGEAKGLCSGSQSPWGGPHCEWKACGGLVPGTLPRGPVQARQVEDPGQAACQASGWPMPQRGHCCTEGDGSQR